MVTRRAIRASAGPAGLFPQRDQRIDPRRPACGNQRGGECREEQRRYRRDQRDGTGVSTPWITLNIAMLARMPSASVSTAAAVNPWRAPQRTPRLAKVLHRGSPCPALTHMPRFRWHHDGRGLLAMPADFAET
jgi:hypothetical protein